ncbi:helix-turn-helix transcriptional regulator [Micromonospora sp. NPDC050980]|uniref:helix-turn-helix transcriptional regulator n=1 Tax=Micromonospora sp. NPDC050980 TaxID=3155161 RepID=UPI003411250D
MVTPEELAAARRLLGLRLAATRKVVGVTQVRLALKVQWSRSTIANVERARQWPPREFWAACDAALGAAGLLVAEWAHTEALSRRLQDQAAVEMIRRQLSQSPPTCLCRDLQRLFRDPAASLYLGVPPAVPARANGGGHGR